MFFFAARSNGAPFESPKLESWRPLRTVKDSGTFQSEKCLWIALILGFLLDETNISYINENP